MTLLKKRKYNFVDLTGKRFGKLLVLDDYKTDRNRGYWLCKCDCGSLPKYMNTNVLVCGKRISCGCLRGGRYPDGVAAFNKLYNGYQSKAAIRNIDFNLSIDEFKLLVDANCYYCNIAPQQIYKTGRNTGYYFYNGIDRIDNDLGYYTDNCVACCGKCNRYKSNDSKEQFLKHIEDIYNNRIKTND